jgi:G:T-mismatch repair DNA endonuclease (very short patch repair protein)
VKSYGFVSIEEELGRNIEQNKRIGRYNADGYDEETNTVYEFNGCFFHGCRKCYHPDDINPLTGDKMSVLYEKTMKKEENLRQMGYNVKSVWSCEFRAPANEEVNGIIKSSSATTNKE